MQQDKIRSVRVHLIDDTLIESPAVSGCTIKRRAGECEFSLPGTIVDTTRKRAQQTKSASVGINRVYRAFIVGSAVARRPVKHRAIRHKRIVWPIAIINSTCKGMYDRKIRAIRPNTPKQQQ